MKKCIYIAKKKEKKKKKNRKKKKMSRHSIGNPNTGDLRKYNI